MVCSIVAAWGRQRIRSGKEGGPQGKPPRSSQRRFKHFQFRPDPKVRLRIFSGRKTCRWGNCSLRSLCEGGWIRRPIRFSTRQIKVPDEPVDVRGPSLRGGKESPWGPSTIHGALRSRIWIPGRFCTPIRDRESLPKWWRSRPNAKKVGLLWRIGIGLLTGERCCGA